MRALYSRSMVWAPEVTVAAVIERHGRFLFVEEQVAGAVVLNQPAGHLEAGESLVDAVIRETHEETGWGFAPEALVGIYLWKHPENGCAILRIAFCGRCHSHDSEQSLDEGIIRTLWLNRDQLLSHRRRLRCPMVLRCVDDYLAGRNFPIDLLNHLDPAHVSARVALV